MSDAEPRPATYIVIQGRTPAMPILYVSSSVRHALLYEPEEMIGRSSMEFLANNRDEEDCKTEYGSITDDNVIMTSIFLKSKYNHDVFQRKVAFVCGNVNFHMITSHPSITRLNRSRPRFTAQRFKCVLGQNGVVRENERRLINSMAATNTAYSMRTTHQACFVLEGRSLSSAHGNRRPKIIFATDSINRILDVDSSDLQGVPFLSLIAVEDDAKAAAFLQRVMQSDELVLESLQILVDPLEGNLMEDPRSVSVEFVAMGSDDGVIMLCQLERSSISQLDDDTRFISLEDIISSDPETSDCPAIWKQVDH